MKNYLFMFLSFFIITSTGWSNQNNIYDDLYSNSDPAFPRLTELFTNYNSSVMLVNQPRAIQQCLYKAMYLPTAREFAEIAQSLGAKGIKEVTEFANPEEAAKAGYYLISAENYYDRKIDNFYYSNFGFKHRVEFYDSIWSSSYHPQLPYTHGYLEYVHFFDTSTGEIGKKFFSASASYPFRCIKR